MPHNECDEILIAFAESQGILTKQASNLLLAGNVAKALGMEAAVNATAALVGTATGAGAMAGMGLSGPPGWVAFGAIMLVGGLAWAISSAVQQADNTIDELVDRLDALDIDGTTVQRQVESWMRALKSYKPALQAPTLGEPAQVAQQSAERVAAVIALVNDLKQMQQAWPGVKSIVKDWKWTGQFGDIGEAETTLNQTTAAIQTLLQQLQAEANKAAQKTLAELQKSSGKDYSAIANKVVELYKQLTAAAGGKEPSFDEPGEQEGYDLAVALSGGKTPNLGEKLQQHIGYMVNLRNKMLQGVKQLQKKSAAKPPLSKRALTLGNGQKVVMPGQKGMANTRKNQKNPVRQMVEALQVAINHLSAKYNSERNRINEDGLYGPQTSGVLSALMTKYKPLRLALEDQAGVNVRTVEDYNRLKRNPRVLRDIYQVLSQFVSAAKSRSPGEGMAATRREEGGYRQREQEPAGSPATIEEIMVKPGDDLTDMEIDLVLRNVMRVPSPVRGRDESAFDYLRHRVGLATTKARAEEIRNAFTQAGGMPKAERWSEWGEALVRHVKQEFGKDDRGQYGILS